jgi:hypothetical protein
MRPIALSLVLLAGCAVTPPDYTRMSTAEVCYRGAMREEERKPAADEVRKRNENCADHMAEITRLREAEARESQMGGGVGSNPGMRQGGMGGGGMGRY